MIHLQVPLEADLRLVVMITLVYWWHVWLATSLDALPHGIVAKILGENIIPIGQIWSTQPDGTQP
jgi:hypothetical protein